MQRVFLGSSRMTWITAAFAFLHGFTWYSWSSCSRVSRKSVEKCDQDLSKTWLLDEAIRKGSKDSTQMQWTEQLHQLRHVTERHSRSSFWSELHRCLDWNDNVNTKCSKNLENLFKALNNKKAVLPQGNPAMPQVFFSVEVRQQHSLQV